MITGVDEVGRGAIAGPIVCASFSINPQLYTTIINKINSLSFKNKTQQKRYKRLLYLTNYDAGLIENTPKHTCKNLNNLKTNCKAKQCTVCKSKGAKIQNNTTLNLQLLSFVNDSKKVTKIKRQQLANYLMQFGKVGFGSASSKKIDQLGLQKANNLSLQKAVKNNKNALVLSDFVFNNKYKSVKKGDSKSFAIACASIIAKEYRDLLMHNYHTLYPQYNFVKNVGYGTKDHLTAIKKYGPCKIHRLSYKLFN